MIQKYKQNGKNVKFDLTYNLIREQPNETRQYAVGVFVTLNNNMNIDPVCLVIMSDETKESFERVFHEFFILMRSCPKIIMTDEQKSMASALEELKDREIFQGHHFIDIFHVLRNAKKSLFHKPSFPYLVSLSQSSNLVEYDVQESVCFR